MMRLWPTGALVLFGCSNSDQAAQPPATTTPFMPAETAQPSQTESEPGADEADNESPASLESAPSTGGETSISDQPAADDAMAPEQMLMPQPLGTCDPQHGYLFCEDFEALPEGPAESPNWTIVKSGSGDAVIDAIQTRGAKALHLTASPGYGNRSVLRREHQAPDNSFWARIWIYVEQWPTGLSGAHYTVMQLNPYTIRPFDGQFFENTPFLSIGADNETGDWNTWNVEPRVAASSGEWMCLETQVDASRNSVSLWVNGQEQPQSAISQSEHPGSGELIFPEFTSMDIGWTLYQGDAQPSTFEVWLDDIVVHTEQVGCDVAAE